MDFSRATGRKERLLIALAVVGVVLRIATLWRGEVLWDGAVYAYMGWSFSETGEFVLPLASSMFAEDAPLYYRHFPPLYPAYLAVFYTLAGFSLEVTKTAAIAASLLLLAVAYLTTRDLFGRRKALYALALVALDPIYLAGTWMTYSESLVGILFVLTMWAILKSLRRESYILLAGLFAGLGFLARSHIGYFFAIAGIAGIAWRFYHVRWRFLRDGWYLAAIGLFVGIVGAWSYRNVLRYGWPHWETSWYVSYAYETASPIPISSPSRWWPRFPSSSPSSRSTGSPSSPSCAPP